MYDYQSWDQEFSSPNHNLENLYQQILAASVESPAEIEIWWRLARVIYQQGMEINGLESIKAKTAVALGYSLKAFQLDANNFEANKWAACSAGKLALFENNAADKIKNIVIFQKHLNACVAIKPEDQITLYMQARFQLALCVLPEMEHSMLVEQVGQLPAIDMNDAETKLIRSIELAPNFIDNYITMAYVQIKQEKFIDAKETVSKGLAVPLITESDKLIAKELQIMKESLG